MTKILFYNERYLELIKSQSKLNYFFLAVIIGLLSLSIQTFNFTEENHFNYLVIGTWLLLLISFFTGFVREMLWIKFRQVDLERSKNEKVASRYIAMYKKHIDRLFWIQFSSFYLAIIFYAIFKISNIYCISFCVQLTILTILSGIGFGGAGYYFRNLAKFAKKTQL